MKYFETNLTDEEYNMINEALIEYVEELNKHTKGVKGILIRCNNEDELFEIARILKTDIMDMKLDKSVYGKPLLSIKAKSYIDSNTL